MSLILSTISTRLTVPSQISRIPLQSDRPAFGVFYILFFLSGFSSLIYQILWTRLLSVTFGHTIYALAAVLTAFMGGLALGSWLAGRIADRLSKPLLLYGLIELAIGIYAFLVYDGFVHSHSLYSPFYDTIRTSPVSLAGIRFLLAILLLGLPTTLMGATLPLLATGAGVDLRSAGRTVGLLYATNTLGAVGGTLFTGFVLIPTHGLLRTNDIAVVLNIGIGLIAVVVSLRLKKESPPALGEEKGIELRERSVFFAAFATGFVALAMEILWTRSLVFTMFLGSSTYAVVTIVGVFLAGISIGALICSRLLSPEFHAPFWFMICEAVVGIASLVCGYLVLAGYVTPSVSNDFHTGVLRDFVRIAALLILPASMMGAAFTILFHFVIRQAQRVGRDIGRLYSMNTCGAILGSFCSGFILIPTLGISKTLAILGSASIVIGVAFYCVAERKHLGLVLACLVPVISSFIFLSGNFKHYLERTGDTVLFYKEGSAATVAVTRGKDEGKYLYVDSTYVQGSNFMLAALDYKMQAHLPMLFGQQPRNVCTIGFGTGGTTYSYTRYSELQSINCVEIDPSILETASLFEESNHGILSRQDPRIRFVFDDAQSYLVNSGEKFDSISVDLTDIAYKSSSSLYSVDFLKACRDSLRPGGINTIWLSLKSLSPENLRILLKTILSAYGPNHVTLWHMTSYPNHDLMVVAVKDRPLKIHFDLLSQRLTDPKVSTDLSEVFLDDPMKLLSSFLLYGTDLTDYLGDAPVHSIDRPILEFQAPKDRFRTFTMWRNIVDLYWQIRNPVPPIIASPEVHSKLREYLYAREFFFQGETSTLRKNNILAGGKSFEHVRFLLPDDKSIAYCLNMTDSQIASYEAEVKVNPGNEDNLILLMTAYIRKGDWENARRIVLLSDRSSNPIFNYLRGRVYEASGEHDKAKDSYGLFLPLATDEYLHEVESRLKVINFEQRRNRTVDDERQLVEAYLGSAEYLKAIQAAESLSSNISAESRIWLASVYRAAGLFTKAEKELRAQVSLHPDSAEGWYYLGDLQLQLRSMDDAGESLKKALSLNDKVPSIHYLLAKYYEISDAKEDAARFLLKAIELGGDQMRGVAASDPVFAYRFQEMH